MDQSYEKLKLAMRYFLIGAYTATKDCSYSQVLEVMEWSETIHDGMRKDGVTKEFMHQLGIAQHIRTLGPHLMNLTGTLSAAFLHDTSEDHTLAAAQIAERFGRVAADDSQRMSKIRNGTKLPLDIYFDELADCPRCSIVKGADRVNNLQSMLGVFSLAKQEEYIDEAEKWILPMLKRARRNFPRQEAAYENIKLMMVSQIELLRANIASNRLVSSNPTT